MRLLANLLVCASLVTLWGCAGAQPAADQLASATGQNPSTDDQSMYGQGMNSEETNADGTQPLFIDVRSQGEWDAGHYEKAVHIPVAEIAERISEVTEDKNAPIVLYCKSGGRAGNAKTELEGLGYTNVINAGGLEDVQQQYP